MFECLWSRHNRENIIREAVDYAMTCSTCIVQGLKPNRGHFRTGIDHVTSCTLCVTQGRRRSQRRQGLLFLLGQTDSATDPLWELFRSTSRRDPCLKPEIHNQRPSLQCVITRKAFCYRVHKLPASFHFRPRNLSTHSVCPVRSTMA
jgi:hypothetical protein